MCSFQCNSEETQNDVFKNCGPIQARISYPLNINLNDIYGPIEDQIQVIKVLNKINLVMKSMKQDIIPGGLLARTYVDT